MIRLLIVVLLLVCVGWTSPGQTANWLDDVTKDILNRVEDVFGQPGGTPDKKDIGGDKTRKPARKSNSDRPSDPHLSRNQVARLQKLLNELGFWVGEPDGLIGRNTSSGIRDYQKSEGLPIDGRATPQLLTSIETVYAQRSPTKSRKAAASSGLDNQPEGTDNGKTSVSMSKTDVARLQTALREMEYNISSVDGNFDKNTADELRSFLTDQGIHDQSYSDAEALDLAESWADGRNTQTIKRIEDALKANNFLRGSGAVDGKEARRLRTAIRQYWNAKKGVNSPLPTRIELVKIVEEGAAQQTAHNENLRAQKKQALDRVSIQKYGLTSQEISDFLQRLAELGYLDDRNRYLQMPTSLTLPPVQEAIRAFRVANGQGDGYEISPELVTIALADSAVRKPPVALTRNSWPTFDPGERLLDIHGEYFAGKVFLPRAPGWCHGEIADLVFIQDSDPDKKFHKDRQQIRGGAKVEQQADAGKVSAMRKIVASISEGCPNVKQIRFATARSDVLALPNFEPSFHSARTCSRADKGWQLEIITPIGLGMPDPCTDKIDEAVTTGSEGIGEIMVSQELRGKDDCSKAQHTKTQGIEKLMRWNGLRLPKGSEQVLHELENSPDARSQRLLAEGKYDELIKEFGPLVAEGSRSTVEPYQLVEILVNLGTAYERLYEPLEAIELYQRAWELAQKPAPEPHTPHLVEGFCAVIKLATLYSRTGRYTDSMGVYDEAVARYILAAKTSEFRLDDVRLLLIRKARLLARLAVLQSEPSVKSSDALETMHQAFVLAHKNASKGEQLPFKEVVLQLLEGRGPDSNFEVLTTAVELARMELDLGDKKVALKLATIAANELQDPSGKVNALSVEAQVIQALAMAATGDSDKAKSILDGAIPNVETFVGSTTELFVTARTARARLALVNGDVSAAVEDLETAVQAIVARSEFLDRSPDLDSRAEMKQFSQTFDLYLDALWRKHEISPDTSTEIGKAFASAQRAQATSAARALAQMAIRFGARDDSLGQVVRMRQDLTDKWERLDSERERLRHEQQQVDRVRLSILGEQLKEISNRRHALDQELAATYPEFAVLTSPQPIKIEEAQSLLRPDEALLNFYVGETATFIWAISKDSVDWKRFELSSQQLDDFVTRLRQGLDPTINSADVNENGGSSFDLVTSYRLYDALIRPIADDLVGKRHLIVVPSGALQSLPLTVLVTAPIDSSADQKKALQNAKWLGKEFALSTLPSVSSLPALRRVATNSSSEKPFLGVGDPTLVGRPDSGGGKQKAVSRGNSWSHLFTVRGNADVDAVRQLTPLPETAEELRSMADALGGGDEAILIGDQATEARLKDLNERNELAHYRVIAFATHGLIAGELEGLAEPALVLTPPEVATNTDDGLLTGSEVAALRLDAEWIILSACNTASGDRPGAESLSGLARAFFYSGARSLLVSHWPVFSVATVIIMSRAFTELKYHPEIGRAEAIRRSITSLISEGKPPQYWAPFTLIGEGGRSTSLSQ